jgi:hypothetical protein
LKWRTLQKGMKEEGELISEDNTSCCIKLNVNHVRPPYCSVSRCISSVCFCHSCLLPSPLPLLACCFIEWSSLFIPSSHSLIQLPSTLSSTTFPFGYTSLKTHVNPSDSSKRFQQVDAQRFVIFLKFLRK